MKRLPYAAIEPQARARPAHDPVALALAWTALAAVLGLGAKVLGLV